MVSPWLEYDPACAPDPGFEYEFRCLRNGDVVIELSRNHVKSIILDLIQGGMIVQYRLREYTHEERCSLWWKVGEAVWVKVSIYNNGLLNGPGEPTYKIGKEFHDATWFTGRKSAVTPPEEE